MRRCRVLIVLGVFTVSVLVVVGFFLDYAMLAKNPELVSALAEGGTAIATVFLGGVTVIAVIMPLVQRSEQQREDAITALRQMLMTLAFIKRRVELLVADPSWDARSLMSGVDSAFSGVMSVNMARSLPRTTRSDVAMVAIFQAHDMLSHAAFLQQEQSADELEIRLRAAVVVKSLRAAYDEIEKALTRFNGLSEDIPLPEEVGELFGDAPSGANDAR